MFRLATDHAPQNTRSCGRRAQTGRRLLRGLQSRMYSTQPSERVLLRSQLRAYKFDSILGLRTFFSTEDFERPVGFSSSCAEDATTDARVTRVFRGLSSPRHRRPLLCRWDTNRAALCCAMTSSTGYRTSLDYGPPVCADFSSTRRSGTLTMRCTNA